jgi:hypothetical protein
MHAHRKSSDPVVTIGIDIGKNTFHLVGLDKRGAIVMRIKVSRNQLVRRLVNLPPCLVGLEAGAATRPPGAHAQQAERVHRIGVISPANDQLTQARLAAFIQGLQRLGWTEGRNVHIDVRWSAADAAETRRHERS